MAPLLMKTCLPLKMVYENVHSAAFLLFSTVPQSWVCVYFSSLTAFSDAVELFIVHFHLQYFPFIYAKTKSCFPLEKRKHSLVNVLRNEMLFPAVGFFFVRNLQVVMARLSSDTRCADILKGKSTTRTALGFNL